MFSGSRRAFQKSRNHREKVYFMADGTELFEIIHTTRAMRRLKPDPVPDAVINRILEAGQCAPNGANTQ
jgi:Nitroreductase family